MVTAKTSTISKGCAMDMIFPGVIAVTIIASFIELIRFKKAGYNCSPLAVSIGLILMWLVIYPFYIIKYREQIIEAANDRGDVLPIIVGKKVALVIYFAITGLWVVLLMTEYVA